ncbi:MAG: cyclase family protein [Dehalococcoidales bacterium]|nr:cyclase family protein [Dehalococcoidales bacterium]
MSRVVDLSLPIKKHWRWFSGTWLRANHEGGEHFRHTMLTMSVHGFTHVDAPGHFVKGGPTIEDVPLERYSGEAAIVDLTHIGAEMGVAAADLEERGLHVRKGDIAILRTDWPRKCNWETMDFMATAPYVTAEACQWLLARGVKAVGTDFPADYVLRHEVTDRTRKHSAADNTTHYNLLAAGVGLIEYLTNLHLIGQPRALIYALPLKIVGSEGSPVRAIAVVEDEG